MLFSKPLWNECKPQFSNKNAYDDSTIILIEKEKLTNNSNEVIKKENLLVHNDKIAKTFDKHFTETVETLNIFEWSSNNKDLLNDQLIKTKYKFQEKFSFKSVPVKYEENKIKTIPNNKVSEG